MRHVHATENCEGEVRIISVKKNATLPDRIHVHHSRKCRSKRHISSTPVDKGRDKRETVAVTPPSNAVVILTVGRTLLRVCAYY